MGALRIDFGLAHQSCARTMAFNQRMGKAFGNCCGNQRYGAASHPDYYL